MDTSDYLNVFLEESDEHLQSINNHILELEQNPGNLEIVNEIFRSAHTLKGMAGTMAFHDIASLTHQMENVFDKMRNNELEVNEGVIEIIFQAVEALEEMVEAIRNGETGSMDVDELVSHLKSFEGKDVDSGAKNRSSEGQPNSYLHLDEYQLTVVKQAEEQGFSAFQITVKLSEDCLLKAARVYMVFEILEELGEIIKSVPGVEELEEEAFETEFSVVILSKASAADIEARIYKVSEIQSVMVMPIDAGVMNKKDKKAQQEQSGGNKGSLDKSKGNYNNGKQASSKTIRVSSERIDHLMNLFEELVLDRGRLEDIAMNKDDDELTETVEHIAKISQDMQDLILTMRMVPVEQVFNRFPRMVRGLAKELDKEIDLEVMGAETELDRTVIDEIGDPLVHLIRNSIDHGIETRAERKRSGKSSKGKLVLRAFHSGNHVFIEIEDDGAGINRDKVIKKAINYGLITTDKAEDLNNEEVNQLIFSSGLSTADKVSDVSGRGVGLDAVSKKIESLGGHISIESVPGQGSKFSIQLPLTLSILSSLLVNVQSEIFGIPLSSVIETVLVEENDFMNSHRQKVMDFRGKVIPILSLQEVLGVPDNQQIRRTAFESVVIVKKGEKMTGLVVDSFIGKKEVVLKSLGNYMKGTFAISGATILGNGKVSLIIDPNALVK
ncbi:chemotaxis protein CheW [Virgibacillus oceani]